ncbi:MAG: M56 family metallopeptidase, partial [Brevundimonas sp.]
MTWALLLSLLVKSSLIAGAGLACSRLLAQRPVDRVDILRGVTCLLLALPVIMAVLPSLELALLPAAEPLVTPQTLPMWEGEVGPVAGVEISGALPWPTPALIVGLIWLVGVAAVAGRLVLGLNTLDRWTQEGRTVKCPAWRTALDTQTTGQPPRLIANDRLSGPLSWGASPGVILVDPASLAERQAAPAILAHELAHLRRKDWVFLVLSRLSLALFWFNPLVWALHLDLVARSEEAADADALTTVDRQVYARALVRLAAHLVTRSIPCAASPMAADARTLKTRIACIMSNTPSRRRPLTVALTVAALAAVATPLAALELSRQDCAS